MPYGTTSKTLIFCGSMSKVFLCILILFLCCILINVIKLFFRESVLFYHVIMYSLFLDLKTYVAVKCGKLALRELHLYSGYCNDM